MTRHSSPPLRQSKASEASQSLLKIRSTGEIVRLKNFSAITQLYEVESFDGKTYSVQSNKISQQVSAEEAKEFGRRQAAK